MATNWTQTSFRLPRTWLKAIKHYGLEHDQTNQEIILEALKEWGDRHGVELPGATADSDSESSDESRIEAA